MEKRLSPSSPPCINHIFNYSYIPKHYLHRHNLRLTSALVFINILIYCITIVIVKHITSLRLFYVTAFRPFQSSSCTLRKKHASNLHYAVTLVQKLTFDCKAPYKYKCMAPYSGILRLPSLEWRHEFFLKFT